MLFPRNYFWRSYFRSYLRFHFRGIKKSSEFVVGALWKRHIKILWLLNIKFLCCVFDWCVLNGSANGLCLCILWDEIAYQWGAWKSYYATSHISIEILWEMFLVHGRTRTTHMSSKDRTERPKKMTPRINRSQKIGQEASIKTIVNRKPTQCNTVSVKYITTKRWKNSFVKHAMQVSTVCMNLRITYVLSICSMKMGRKNWSASSVVSYLIQPVTGMLTSKPSIIAEVAQLQNCEINLWD